MPKQPAGEIKERELEAHDQSPTESKNGNDWITSDMGIKHYALKFIFTELSEDKDTQLVERAAYQNNIIRAFFSDKIVNMETYRSRLTSSIAEFCKAMGKPNMSGDLARVFDGIEPAIYGIEQDRKDFGNRPKPQEGEKQFVGLNDILDAHHSIDYVDIRMSADGQSPIAPIRLVQVKRGVLSPDEIRKIHKKHQTYVDGLMPRSFLADSIRSNEREYLSNELFKNEMFGLDQKGRDAFLFDKWSTFISELIKLTDENITNSSFDALSEKSQIPGVFIKMMFKRAGIKAFNDLVSTISDSSALDVEKAILRLVHVKQYVETVGISAEEHLALNPEWTPSPTLIRSIKFESVIWHNGVRVADPLTANTALTIH